MYCYTGRGHDGSGTCQILHVEGLCVRTGRPQRKEYFWKRKRFWKRFKRNNFNFQKKSSRYSARKTLTGTPRLLQRKYKLWVFVSAMADIMNPTIIFGENQTWKKDASEIRIVCVESSKWDIPCTLHIPRIAGICTDWILKSEKKRISSKKNCHCFTIQYQKQMEFCNYTNLTVHWLLFI